MKKVSAPSLQRGIAENPRRNDDSTVKTFLEWRRDDGQTFAEYAVILAVITPAIVLTLSMLSGRVAGFFTSFAAIIP